MKHKCYSKYSFSVTHAFFEILALKRASSLGSLRNVKISYFLYTILMDFTIKMVNEIWVRKFIFINNEALKTSIRKLCLKSETFCHVTPYSPVDVHRQFRRNALTAFTGSKSNPSKEPSPLLLILFAWLALLP
jgi:hypothetical protein